MVDAGDFSENRVTEFVSGRFRMRRLVAFGGMANIYEAEDLKTGRVGALKLLKARFRHVPDAVERLSREARVATRIADTHIVQTFDAGRLDSGEPFLFMELLNGETLSQRIARQGGLPIVDAVDIVTQAAQGLVAAHAADVLHRDIKPANLFLVAGPRCLVKLLDFGVSKFVGTGSMSLTREGLALGTFSYMPPEQMMGAQRVDARADVYSLGVVLYQCLVGTPPFVAKSILALSNLMARSEYTRVSQLRSDAPRELDSILWRSLRADPNDRYASARDLREDLLRLSRRSLPQRSLGIGAASPVPPAVAPAVSRSASPRPPAVSRAAAVPAAYPLRPAAVPRSSRSRETEASRIEPRAPTRVDALVEVVIPRPRRPGERERS